MSQKQHHKDDDNQTENGMVRGLQNRHVQLIAIAGTIGTGLFLGAGRSLSLTGPSIILVYILTGIFMYLMMRAIGEMLYMDPDQPEKNPQPLPRYLVIKLIKVCWSGSI